MFGVGTKAICRYSYQRKHSQCKGKKNTYTPSVKGKHHLQDEKYCNKKRITLETITTAPAKTSLRLQLLLENYIWLLGSELIEGINK